MMVQEDPIELKKTMA